MGGCISRGPAEETRRWYYYFVGLPPIEKSCSTGHECGDIANHLFESPHRNILRQLFVVVLLLLLSFSFSSLPQCRTQS
jgi:hypothetical protein